MQTITPMIRLFAAVSALLIASDVSACSCAPAPTAEEEFDHAAVVFAGTVTSIEDPGGDRLKTLPEVERMAAQRRVALEPWGPEWGRKVTFRVMQWWKTDEVFADTVELWTGYGFGDCGYRVEEGKSYLIYAQRSTATNRLVFGICGRTAALVCAARDVEQLGEPIKTYESFDTQSLIDREQPYTTYWRPCIKGPLLIGERGLKMDKHCGFQVHGVIGRDGVVRDFRIVRKPKGWRCPESLARHITEQVAEWRFRPAEIDGQPVETLLQTVSMREPANEAEYAKFLKERAEWQARQKKPDR